MDLTMLAMMTVRAPGDRVYFPRISVRRYGFIVDAFSVCRLLRRHFVDDDILHLIK